MKLGANDAAELAKNGKRAGGIISESLVRHITDQLKARLEQLREAGHDLSYRRIAFTIAASKAWVSDVFLYKYTDMRFSSMARLATVLGCEWRVTLVPKEMLNDPEYLALDGSSEEQKRELTPRERDILCWVISRVERDPDYNDLGIAKLNEIRDIIDPRPR